MINQLINQLSLKDYWTRIWRLGTPCKCK